MKITRAKPAGCLPGQSHLCTDAFLLKLPNLKLKADTPADTVNGSISIYHGNPHIIFVEVVEAEDGRFKKPLVIPTVKEVTDSVNSI